ncbi:putative protein YciH [Halomonadaceae bacterium LMG 33818]|uniref:translation initiation factor n=1 Tax=Cernens ardua TaxID=3402176 RepID=UPI003EDCB233
MSSLKDQLKASFGNSLVYSTDNGDLRGQSHASEQEQRDQERLDALDGIVRIRRETSGRKGKGVTTIHGVPIPEAKLKILMAELKKKCGSGGALKNGIIEIQGDHRNIIRKILEQKGFKVKLAGG